MVAKNKGKTTLTKPKKNNSSNQTDNVWGAPVKYTLEFVTQELKSMLSTLKEDKDIIYIWELFEDKDYSRQRYSEWVKQYNEIEDVKQLSDTIKEILETRAIKGAMTNKLNATSTIFHLKNNYKWVDKQEIDQTTKQVNYTKEEWADMSDEEIDKIISEI